MPSLLHINASPKADQSVSLRLASRFLAELQRLEPQVEIDRIDLFEEPLAEFGKTAADAKFAPILGRPRTPDEERVWSEVLQTIERFDAADRLVISSPMWNYSVPYRLKHYLDLIVQPRVTVGYDPQSMAHHGLLKNRPVQLILTRSSVMPGDFSDFQLPYLKFILDLIGLRDIAVVSAWRTTQASAEAREAYIRAFDGELEQAAHAFLARPSKAA